MKKSRDAIVQIGMKNGVVHGIDPHVSLVKGGRLAYLWVGDSTDGCYATLSGSRTLRKLAQAILDEVPA